MPERPTPCSQMERFAEKQLEAATTVAKCQRWQTSKLCVTVLLLVSEYVDEARSLTLNSGKSVIPLLKTLIYLMNYVQ